MASNGRGHPIMISTAQLVRMTVTEARMCQMEMRITTLLKRIEEMEEIHRQEQEKMGAEWTRKMELLEMRNQQLERQRNYYTTSDDSSD